MSSLSEHWVQDYYDLQTVLLDYGLITITSGTKESTPTISSLPETLTVYDTSADITITDYDSSKFYFVTYSGGTLSRNVDELSWQIPLQVGTFSTNVYSVSVGKVLSDSASKQYIRTEESILPPMSFSFSQPAGSDIDMFFDKAVLNGTVVSTGSKIRCHADQGAANYAYAMSNFIKSDNFTIQCNFTMSGFGWPDSQEYYMMMIMFKDSANWYGVGRSHTSGGVYRWRLITCENGATTLLTYEAQSASYGSLKIVKSGNLYYCYYGTTYNNPSSQLGGGYLPQCLNGAVNLKIGFGVYCKALNTSAAPCTVDFDDLTITQQ